MKKKLYFEMFQYFGSNLEGREKNKSYRAFHRFGQVKFPDGGSVLGMSQILILHQLPPKTMLGLKEVKLTQN